MSKICILKHGSPETVIAFIEIEHGNLFDDKYLNDFNKASDKLVKYCDSNELDPSKVVIDRIKPNSVINKDTVKLTIAD